MIRLSCKTIKLLIFHCIFDDYQTRRWESFFSLSFGHSIYKRERVSCWSLILTSGKRFTSKEVFDMKDNLVYSQGLPGFKYNYDQAIDL